MTGDIQSGADAFINNQPNSFQEDDEDGGDDENNENRRNRYQNSKTRESLPLKFTPKEDMYVNE